MEKIQIPTPQPRKISTKEKILQIRKENPRMSCKEIAEKLGTSPIYVSQCSGKKGMNKAQRILKLKKQFPQFDHFDISKIVGANPGYVQVCLKKSQAPKPKVVSVPTKPTQTQISDKVNFVLEFLIQNPNFEMIVTEEIPTGKRILILK